MIELLIKRAAWAVLVLFVVVSSVFFLANYIGDPASAILGAQATPAQRAQYRRVHGLDRPVSEQYVKYLIGVAHGDLGKSLKDDQPVVEVLLQRLPRTALLGSMALFFELCIGLGFGIFAAVRRNTWVDTTVMSAAFVGVCLPSFVTGPFFLREIAFRLGWFPVGGYGRDALDHVYHAILPALTLAIIGAATYARVMRSEMIEMLRADFVRTARAKGATATAVVLRHAARNALLPIVTMLGLSLPLIVTGAIITEKIYDWPGVGRLAIESIDALDLPMILGIVLLASMTVQVGNFLADISVAALDPRIRANAKS